MKKATESSVQLIIMPDNLLIFIINKGEIRILPGHLEIIDGIKIINKLVKLFNIPVVFTAFSLMMIEYRTLI